MRTTFIVLFLFFFVAGLLAQSAQGPTNEKAQKTFKKAQEYLQHGMTESALGEFKKADKQDGGHCLECERQEILCALPIQDWRSAEAAAQATLENAHTPTDMALAHYDIGMVFAREGHAPNKEQLLTQGHEELIKALTLAPNFPEAIFADGLVLAELKQDDAAKAQFQKFLTFKGTDEVERGRASRYIEDPDLVRERMAPAFVVTAMDGRRVSLDGLTGKVVLIDFWATWCEPCREALPHIKELAKKFQDQPLVILSVSLDTDQSRWKEFVAKNNMTWLQYYDGGFEGPMARLFDVRAIPQTFTIDADGVLQDQHIGDASIEGKLRKLIAQAQDLKAAEKTP